MVDLRTVLAQDIADFARRVLAGNGTPQEVAVLPAAEIFSKVRCSLQVFNSDTPPIG